MKEVGWLHTWQRRLWPSTLAPLQALGSSLLCLLSETSSFFFKVGGRKVAVDFRHVMDFKLSGVEAAKAADS